MHRGILVGLTTRESCGVKSVTQASWNKENKMPNWCGNTLVIRGPKEDRDTFVNGIPISNENKPFNFIEHYVPLPDDIGDGWYDWAIENWGTKWGDCEMSVLHHNDKETALGFSTAWGPPIPAIITISQLFPTLQFVLAYEEGGMCFLGAVGVVGGMCVYDKFIEGAEYENLYPERQDYDDDIDTYYESGYEAVIEELSRISDEAWEHLGNVTSV
jgi:hypothetical protein